MPAFGEFTPGTVNVRIRTPTGEMAFDLADFGPYPIWSTVTLSTTQSSEITYFQYGRGSPKPGASAGVNGNKLDTNLDNNSGQLGASNDMLVWALRLVLDPDITLPDIQDILNKTYTAFYVNSQKPSLEGRAEFFPAGGGIAGMTTANNQQTWTNGGPSANAGRVLASPHFIGPITPFRAVQEFMSALALAAARDPTLVADGLRRRSVS